MDNLVEWNEKIFIKIWMEIKMRIAWWQFCFSNVKSFVTNIVTFLNICHIPLSECQSVTLLTPPVKIVKFWYNSIPNHNKNILIREWIDDVPVPTI